MTDRLSFAMVASAAAIPLTLAVLAAWPLWKRHVRDEMGSILGAFIAFACAIGFIAREFGQVLRTSKRCVELGVICRFEPSDFTRYAIFAGIAMAQVFVLFLVGASIEARHRRSNP